MSQALFGLADDSLIRLFDKVVPEMAVVGIGTRPST